jgi:uncharacterized protein YjbI with pentapeptide repeats
MTTELGDVWKVLTGKGTLASLDVPLIGGRKDLRGLRAPRPTQGRRIGRAIEMVGIVVIRGASWRGLDFANADLGSLRFFDCRIEDCIFDRAKCVDWRMWGTSISNCRFHNADLRTAALGGVDGNKRNVFKGVDFSEADLRQTAYQSADFIECTFRDTKLGKVNFQGSVFKDCTFEGELDEVVFQRFAFEGEGLPPNTMDGVDFSNAQLRSVEFRNLDLKNVAWPQDDEHIIVGDYVKSLDRAITALSARADVPSRKLAAYLGGYRRFAGSAQRVGIFNKKALAEVCGANAPTDLANLVGGS